MCKNIRICAKDRFCTKPSCQIPGGIFGPENEATLFDSINITDPVERMKASQKKKSRNLIICFRLSAGSLGRCPSIHRSLSNQHVVATINLMLQHLLVLLFGTFRIIAANSQAQGTNMTAQALGVR